jgi:Uma2 family endonuclease
MVVVQPLLTPNDLERMARAGELDREAQFELVNGEIIWLTFASLYHNRVSLAIALLLAPFAERVGAILFPDGAGFRTGPNHMNVRGPDAALVSRERRHIVPRDAMWGAEAPDLCVEVLSPEQHGEAYAHSKVAEYFEAGARVVWLVNHEVRTVRAYEAGRRDFTTYSGDGEITLDAIAPGFRSPVSAFFPAD